MISAPYIRALCPVVFVALFLGGPLTVWKISKARTKSAECFEERVESCFKSPSYVKAAGKALVAGAFLENNPFISHIGVSLTIRKPETVYLKYDPRCSWCADLSPPAGV